MSENKHRVIVNNRKAYHDYTILDTIECGIVLVGKEVKALRQGKGNLKGAWCDIQKGEMFVRGMHISPFQENSISKNSVLYTDPYRERKLLLHKLEIRRLAAQKSQDGITLIPLEAYFDNQNVKIKLGICKGKHNYDKRETEKKKASIRELREV